MGGTAPRSLCLGGELPIPLRGAAIRSPTVDQKPTRRETHSISTHPWTETRSLGWLLPHLPPPTTDGPAYTAPPQWTTLIPPLTQDRLRRGQIETEAYFLAAFLTVLDVFEKLFPVASAHVVALSSSKAAHLCSIGACGPVFEWPTIQPEPCQCVHHPEVTPAPISSAPVKGTRFIRGGELRRVGQRWHGGRATGRRGVR